MKPLFAFIWKEVRHILRDGRTLFVILVMPLAQVLTFGYGITTDIQEVRIGIYDAARDPASRELTRYLLATHQFELGQYFVSEREFDAAMRRGDVRAIIVFPPDFGATLQRTGMAQVQFLVDASEPNTASTLTGFASTITQRWALQQGSNTGQPWRIALQPRMQYNEALNSAYGLVPGVTAVILLLICALVTSVSIAKEKELGTMEVLLVSPLRPWQIVVGKLVPYLALGLIDAALVLGLGAILFEVPMRGNWLLLLLVVTLFVMASLALGLLISTVVDTQQNALLGSMMGLMLPSIMLSGYIFPLDSMPRALQIISNIVPARWFLSALRDIMLKGSPLAQVWPPIAVLAGMTALLLTVSILRLKPRLA